MSSDEYKQALDFMEKSLVERRGMIGIFWYSPINNSLFGVHKESPFDKTINCGDNFVSCSFDVEDYKDKPCGRIIFDPSNKQFIVCVGSWISDYPDAIDVIVDEFALENENYEFTTLAKLCFAN